MNELSPPLHQIRTVKNFKELVSTPFQDEVNALCWTRECKGDFEEIVQKIPLHENLNTLSLQQLKSLKLSERGHLAREIIINDFSLLEAHGAAPTLNLIKCYDRDDAFPFFPTDAYSFHVDRAPIASDTFLCTYYGDASEIIPNDQAEQKILVPEIRAELKKLYDGPEDGFEAFLTEHFFDLHYQAKPNAHSINLGLGNLWRLAIDHPELQVPPCVHRAPIEASGQIRLMLIC